MNTGTIKILIGNRVVGAIQSFEFDDVCPIAITSDRDIKEKNFIGPKISASRVRFDRVKISEAFSRGYLNAKSQMYPLQIVAENEKEVCTVQNAWISSQDYTYTTGDWLITDAIEFEAEKVFETKK